MPDAFIDFILWNCRRRNRLAEGGKTKTGEQKHNGKRLFHRDLQEIGCVSPALFFLFGRLGEDLLTGSGGLCRYPLFYSGLGLEARNVLWVLVGINHVWIAVDVLNLKAKSR
jgi:hypothetical protein